jgi:hypothetical protein
MTVAVAAAPGGSMLRLGIQAKGLSAGRRKGAPPVFQSRTLTVASATSETRLSRIFATARALRTRKSAAAVPLIGDARAEGVRIEAPGSRAALRATFDAG